ncbi:hypothetical protein AY605_07230 [Acinetobacter sp. SFD]|uniref:hypothetical protein n=1 Tax=Acinetobacter sp. SFD TaxID=1805635 RepID=UPI0007D0B7C2|nr:hypothetical protein [Acinetobacter sp. SFD]OAL84450.1 hypothetical protein AY605_07230 [Acinetobacter sp. SFD]
MDIQEIQEKFEDLLLANPDFDESLLEKDEEGCYSDSDIQHMYSMFEAGTEVGEQWQAAKAQAVPEKDAVIKKLSDQLYEQEMKTSDARVLCETACELLDNYVHQDAMVILNDLEQAMSTGASQ